MGVGVGVGVGVGLVLWVDGEGLATGSELAAAAEFAAISGLDAVTERPAKGLKAADGAVDAVEIGAELTVAAMPCPLVRPL